MVKSKQRGKRQIGRQSEMLAGDCWANQEIRAPPQRVETEIQHVEPLKTTQRTTTRFYAYKETPI